MPVNRSNARMPSSNVLDSVDHLLGLVDFPDEEEACDELPDAAAVLTAEDDSSVLRPRSVEPQEIAVLREDDAARRHGVGDVLLILGTEQARLRSRRHIDPMQAK